jgi:glycosyltransferase involved in cell wall biosynthesis
VISTNESYREVAVTRSGKSAADVTVVRTGPDPEQLRRGQPHPELRRGRRFLAAYIGVMGPQDGVDIVVRAADIVVHQFGRDDIAFTLIGSGDCFDDLERLTKWSRRSCPPRTRASRRTRRIRSTTCPP